MTAVSTLLESAETALDAGDLSAAVSRATAAALALEPEAVASPIRHDCLRSWVRARRIVADSRQAAGEYDEAVRMLEEVVEVVSARGLNPARHLPELANSLAVALRYAGEWDRAADLFYETLGWARKDRSLRLGSIASIMHNLSGLAAARGRGSESVEWAREAKRLRRADGAARGVHEAGDEAALAAALDAVEAHAEAERGHRDALHRLIALRGPIHYDVAAALGNLAACLHAQLRHDEAEPLYLRSLSVRSALGLERHAETGVVRNNLGLLHHATGRLQTAAQHLKHALQIVGEALGEHHGRTRSVAANYAKIVAHGGQTSTEEED